MSRLPMLLVLGLINVIPAPQELRIQGRVVDQAGLTLPGVTVRLSASSGPAAYTAVTDTDGMFDFDVGAGPYRLDAQLDGFEPNVREIEVRGSTVLPDIVLRLARHAEETTVVGRLPTEVQPRQFGTAATISDEVIENAPQRSSRYDDVLPLIPNVVRGPDGLVSVAGARAPQGIVLLNGVPASDLASGEPLAPVPLGAVETVQVITTGFPAESGPSTGGVTIINSRPGSDVFRIAVNSFTPRPRLSDGAVQGIEAWEPNASVRGPLVRGRAWLAQSFDYHFERTRAETVAGAQDRRQHGFTSFTQLDLKARDGHLVTAWVNGEQGHVEGERLGAFNPLGTVPNVDRGTWHGAVIDRLAFGMAVLETRGSVRHQDVALLPEGAGSYLVGHDYTRGEYFGTVDRQANAYQAAAVFSQASNGRLGRHLVKAGASLDRRELDGLERNQPVAYLRSTLVQAQVIEFVGPGRYDAAMTQLGFFVQDGWDVTNTLRLDSGIRLDHDSRTGSFAAPRVGLTWNLREGVTLSGGGGWFADDLVLAPLAFEGFQSRRVALFDEQGVQVAAPTTYRNMVSEDLARGRARIWSARVDFRLGRGWQLRLAGQERHGTHETIVVPSDFGGEPVALMATTGESRNRSLETTVGYHPSARHQFYVSYVRSSGRGNTNDFGQVEGLFRDPRLAPPETAALPADVPHRVLAWGTFSLPARVTVAPFFDIRSGFPYSALADDWTYVTPRMDRRYPLFASLDVVVNKIVDLPGGLRARVGIKLYNVAGRGNGREVQADINRPDFGRTYNALGRQVRGVFEIIWNRQ